MHCNQTYKIEPTAKTQQKAGKEAAEKPATAKPGTRLEPISMHTSVTHKQITPHGCTYALTASPQLAGSVHIRSASAVKKSMMKPQKTTKPQKTNNPHTLITDVISDRTVLLDIAKVVSVKELGPAFPARHGGRPTQQAAVYLLPSPSATQDAPLSPQASDWGATPLGSRR